MHINLPEKRYYKIGEVAKAFNVNTSLVRFWEKEFDIIKPKKNAKGNRLFTPEDIKNFKLIFNLVKERGFTLDIYYYFVLKSKFTSGAFSEPGLDLKRFISSKLNIPANTEFGKTLICLL